MYPRHLHKPGGLYVVAGDAGEHEQLTARGWELLPSVHVEKPVEVRLFDALQEPIADAPSEDADADDAPKRRGRKPKGE